MLYHGPEYILRECYAAWSRADYDAALSYCSDDVVFAMYLPKDVVPFGGEAHGLEEFRGCLKAILKDFEHVYYRPLNIVVSGQFGRAQIHFCFRHRATGRELDGVMRHEVMIKDNKIASMREYHDTERIRAFMQLTAASK